MKSVENCEKILYLNFLQLFTIKLVLGIRIGVNGHMNSSLDLRMFDKSRLYDDTCSLDHYTTIIRKSVGGIANKIY